MYCWELYIEPTLLSYSTLRYSIHFLLLLYNVTLQPQAHASEICHNNTTEVSAHRQQASLHVVDVSFAIGIVDNCMTPVLILNLQQLLSTSNNNRSASIIIKIFLAMVASCYVLYMETDPFEEDEVESK